MGCIDQDTKIFAVWLFFMWLLHSVDTVFPKCLGNYGEVFRSRALIFLCHFLPFTCSSDGPDPGSLQWNVRLAFGTRMKSKESRRMLFHQNLCRALHSLGEHREIPLTFSASNPRPLLSRNDFIQAMANQQSKETKQASLSWCLFLNDASRSSH